MKTIIFALLLAVSAQAQDFKFIPLKYDRLWSEDGLILRWDGPEHSIRDGALFYSLRFVGIRSYKPRAIIAVGANLGWETFDGFRWRKTDGFSVKDFCFGVAGFHLVYIGEKIFDKPKPKKYDRALRKELDYASSN